ncbi:PfkB family carbohydrate kinase [Halobacterium yunchengense]|uniref:PfkB family carbohydrate kinase n=1 Tax=Halobacterium yunchengense TaxID=3108497 RepID=UPI00300B1989
MDLAGRLADAPSPTVTALPDGSVDRRFGVLGADREPATRESFVEQVAGGRRSFVTERRGVEPGGQAVNAALQAAALDAAVDLYGHLDDEVFEALDASPIRAHSMGAPADVHVYEFRDAAVMLTAESRDVREWSFDGLAAAGGAAALDADAVVWTNWESTPNGTEALRRAAARADGAGGGRFVVDPGAVVARPAADRSAFLDALADLAAGSDVVVSVNDEELEGLAAVVDADAPGTADAERTAALAAAVREHTGAAGVVMHGVEAAVAATGDGRLRVPNFETPARSRFTGGGDRFSAALAFARACEWPWRPALALGNAAASHYVETGSTGDRAALAAYAAERA